MTNNVVTAKSNSAIGLEGIEAHQEIKRIADAVIKRKIASAMLLTEECRAVAHEHYVRIGEVYKRVWLSVKDNSALQPTHPAGNTEAYHTLRQRAEH
ncbi:MAG: hypothetical protein EOT05_03075 [Candidatus Microsaccharimonas sossegonensis]|uniref:Uncharacterized protein n=1 Tax=Candidatus Microsaccharimonas sossegonensis TaxID=2506948 RepID=A0A4Q0AHP5_9BACT|nr:MAG: hypothetical protein EOT05_03075 [Candidatus Microsaccharimonas sossegonensis]